MYDLPTVTVRGSLEAMGEGQGEAFRETIQRFVPMRFAAVHDYFEEFGRGSVPALREVGRQCFALFQTWDPDGYREH